MATERMLAGLSARKYPIGLEPVGVAGSGTAKTAVSNRFIARTRTALGELLSRDLTELKLCGCSATGSSSPIIRSWPRSASTTRETSTFWALKEGSTENATVCKGLLSDLVDRGLDVSGGILLVLDRGKGWKKAVRDVFGDLALTQRCRLHKERNVLGYLPDHMHPEVRRPLRKAWRKTDPDEALRRLESLARWLEGQGHPSAAGSVREGIEETVTINRLGVPDKLAVSLYSTNIMAEVWLRMAFFAANPGIEAEDDWGIELPTVSEEAPDVEALLLRTVSF